MVMWLTIAGEPHREWDLARLLGLHSALCSFLFPKSFLFSFLTVNTRTLTLPFSLSLMLVCLLSLRGDLSQGDTGKD